MGVCGQPLFRKNDDEQRRHGKVDASGVKGNDIANQIACDAADNPVALIHSRHENHSLLLIQTRRKRGAAKQRIGLVCQ